MTRISSAFSLKDLNSDDPRRGYSKYLRMPLKRFAQQWPGVGSRALVIATPSEFELLAIPFARRLGLRGVSAHCSCVWPSHRFVGKERKAEIAPISMSFDQAPIDNENTDLIIISSFVDTTTVIESMLTYAHPIPHMRYESISVFAPFARRGTHREFKLALRDPELDQFVWQNTIEFSEDVRDELRPLVDSWTAQALRLDSPEAVGSYFPRSIRAYLDNQPRPDNSFMPKPSPMG